MLYTTTISEYPCTHCERRFVSTLARYRHLQSVRSELHVHSYPLTLPPDPIELSMAVYAEDDADISIPRDDESIPVNISDEVYSFFQALICQYKPMFENVLELSPPATDFCQPAAKLLQFCCSRRLSSLDVCIQYNFYFLYVPRKKAPVS